MNWTNNIKIIIFDWDNKNVFGKKKYLDKYIYIYGKRIIFFSR